MGRAPSEIYFVLRDDVSHRFLGCKDRALRHEKIQLVTVSPDVINKIEIVNINFFSDDNLPLPTVHKKLSCSGKIHFLLDYKC